MNSSPPQRAATAFAGFCLVAPAMAQGFRPTTSVTGSYLAGTQALSELRTPDAVRYLGDAVNEAWDNPSVLNRAFIAYAAKPIREPVFQHGPFVMNHRAEIVQAIEDYQRGAFGPIP